MIGVAAHVIFWIVIGVIGSVYGGENMWVRCWHVGIYYIPGVQIMVLISLLVIAWKSVSGIVRGLRKGEGIGAKKVVLGIHGLVFLTAFQTIPMAIQFTNGFYSCL